MLQPNEIQKLVAQFRARITDAPDYGEVGMIVVMYQGRYKRTESILKDSTVEEFYQEQAPEKTGVRPVERTRIKVNR